MSKVEIKHRFSDSVLFTAELDAEFDDASVLHGGEPARNKAEMRAELERQYRSACLEVQVTLRAWDKASDKAEYIRAQLEALGDD